MKKMYVDVDGKSFRIIVDEIKSMYPWMDLVYDVKVNSISEKNGHDLISVVKELSKKFRGKVFTYINDPFYTVVLNGETTDWGLKKD